ncbi:alpha/beta hydrolase [Candidatus Pacearchaeota archaeon]|nr:alpha/beta hydrolase [Candidatus Pacearchaeota archaeon]
MKKRNLYIVLALIFILLITIIYFSIESKNKDKYYFKGNTFSYSQNRGSPVYNISLKEENATYSIYRVNFESRNFLNYSTTIYGLLIMPKNIKNVPGLILLPGGAVKKESESILASKIANLGYAVLTFDQRGIGETGGYYLSFEDDYRVFSQGKEPIQHLSVYDALKAYDVLKKIKGVDKNNIAVAGESMGGRYAIITAAIDKRLKGVIAISSSGFHFKDENQPYTPYLLSIDPDHYIDKISPNNVFMLHSLNDSTISINDSKETFSLAKDPKKFYEVKNCAHGYCNEMYNELKDDLKVLFGK